MIYSDYNPRYVRDGKVEINGKTIGFSEYSDESYHYDSFCYPDLSGSLDSMPAPAPYWPKSVYPEGRYYIAHFQGDDCTLDKEFATYEAAHGFFVRRRKEIADFFAMK